MDTTEFWLWVIVVLGVLGGLALMSLGLSIVVHDALSRRAWARNRETHAQQLLRAELDEPAARPDEILVASHDLLLGLPPAFDIRRGRGEA